MEKIILYDGYRITNVFEMTLSNTIYFGNNALEKLFRPAQQTKDLAEKMII